MSFTFVLSWYHRIKTKQTSGQNGSIAKLEIFAIPIKGWESRKEHLLPCGSAGTVPTMSFLGDQLAGTVLWNIAYDWQQSGGVDV